MKRRSFSLLAGTSLAALKFRSARAQTTKDPSLLKTTLTPIGSERAGNADGSIPAWTGGFTDLPEGWTPNQPMPDFFASEQPVVVINSGNMAKYADRLSAGIMTMMQKYSYSIKVYPTHRTACAPQWVYDNTASNLTTAQLDPGGGRLGFSNAFGGYPFPIPDIENPLDAGAQIMWNHECRWQGESFSFGVAGWCVNGGGAPVLANHGLLQVENSYYDKSGTLATYTSGLLNREKALFDGPTNIVGQDEIVYYYSNARKNPTRAWEVLAGQGRVRRAPELSFDTPSSEADGITNYDEYYAFTGSLEEYDWKYLGKKELYIPYNVNGLCLGSAQDAMKAYFLDPSLVRWELHRVWVVEATLHAGERNVLARRRFYFDEDTWTVALFDAWDAQDNLYHIGTTILTLRPDMPGVFQSCGVVANVQTGGWVTLAGLWNQTKQPSLAFNVSSPSNLFDPQNLAAASLY